MHTISILNKQMATKITYKNTIQEPFVIISIKDRSEKNNKFNRNNPYLKEVLYLTFDDITEQIEEGIIMNTNDVRLIKQFIDIWKDKVKYIIVHCYAGISRSSAIACGLNLYLNSDDMIVWNNPRFAPNLHCFRLMIKELRLGLNEEDIQKRIDINNKEYKKYLEDENIDLDKIFKFKESELG